MAPARTGTVSRKGFIGRFIAVLMGYATRSATILLAFGLLAGCTRLTPPAPSPSPLRPPRMSPDSVVLELFFVHVPLGDPLANEEVWGGLDEQCLDPSSRHKLARNGFRVGFCGSQITDELVRLMDIEDKPVPTDMTERVEVTDIDQEPAVLRRHMQLRAGRIGHVISSPVYDELTVLLREADHVGGFTEEQAQAMWELRPLPLPDGRVRLDLLPVIEYGQAQQRWASQHGALRLDSGRPRHQFDDLTISLPLAPGEMLVLTCQPDLPAALASHFFTDASGGALEQKVLVVRLVQTQHNEFFGPDGILPLDD